MIAYMRVDPCPLCRHTIQECRCKYGRVIEYGIPFWDDPRDEWACTGDTPEGKRVHIRVGRHSSFPSIRFGIKAARHIRNLLHKYWPYQSTDHSRHRLLDDAPCHLLPSGGCVRLRGETEVIIELDKATTYDHIVAGRKTALNAARSLPEDPDDLDLVLWLINSVTYFVVIRRPHRGTYRGVWPEGG